MTDPICLDPAHDAFRAADAALRATLARPLRDYPGWPTASHSLAVARRDDLDAAIAAWDDAARAIDVHLDGCPLLAAVS